VHFYPPHYVFDTFIVISLQRALTHLRTFSLCLGSSSPRLFGLNKGVVVVLAIPSYILECIEQLNLFLNSSQIRAAFSR
jgi:hypothetical protein